MGMGFGVSSSSHDTQYVEVEVKPKYLPDANNYIIEELRIRGEYLILLIRYPNCTNYEGRKILVFYKTKVEDLINQKTIDPHFSDNKDFKSPIARFAPTETGMEMAEKCCRAYTPSKK